MLNVIVALKLWNQVWTYHRIKINCNNRAVVDVLHSGYARDGFHVTCARNVWLLTAFLIFL